MAAITLVLRVCVRQAEATAEHEDQARGLVAEHEDSTRVLLADVQKEKAKGQALAKAAFKAGEAKKEKHMQSLWADGIASQVSLQGSSQWGPCERVQGQLIALLPAVQELLLAQHAATAERSRTVRAPPSLES